jgi:lipopolysaccharide/colanic/teichoic acid biosynthesis glycosyltransferase
MMRNYNWREEVAAQGGAATSAQRAGHRVHEYPLGSTVIALGDSTGAPVFAAPAHSRLKRRFDLLAGIFLLICFAPLLMFLALAVSRDGGPVLFGHRRIGAGGRPFTCWKFRSMVVDAEAVLARTLATDSEARREWQRDFKLRKDPRVTPLGRFLRKSSLDELPQLFGVITGDMSLIGPRPIVAEEIGRYGAGFADYAACRPGITGLWQVSGRNDVDYAERVAIDSRYARTWSFMGDMAILYRTVGVVLRRDGAY